MSDDRDSAQYEPSANRLKRAREHGMVPFSPQMAMAIQLCAAMAGLVLFVGSIANGIAEWTKEQWKFSENSVGGVDVLTLSPGAARFAVVIVLMLIVLFICNVASHVIQKGFLIPTRQLFDINNLMPFANRQSVTPGERVWMFCLKLIQLVVVVAAVGLFFKNRIHQVIQLWELESEEWLQALSSVVFGLAIAVSVCLLVLSFADYGWNVWRHRQRLKMTDVELKEENRTEESDPKLKAMRRTQHRRIARKS